MAEYFQVISYDVWLILAGFGAIFAFLILASITLGEMVKVSRQERINQLALKFLEEETEILPIREDILKQRLKEKFKLKDESAHNAVLFLKKHKAVYSSLEFRKIK